MLERVALAQQLDSVQRALRTTLPLDWSPKQQTKVAVVKEVAHIPLRGVTPVRDISIYSDSQASIRALG